MANHWKKITAIACLTAIAGGVLAGCGGGGGSKIDKENPSISIMTESYQMDPATKDSPVYQALEEYLGTKLDIQFTPNSGYNEKVTAAMGSGSYPNVMLVKERNSSVIQNSRSGSFWEVGDKIKDSAKYPNLSRANEVILNNTSIDGKVYGLYRARELGRAGMTIRKDWLDNLNMSMPTTVDELYEVLKAFKEKDPDKNGQDDTFGIIVTKSPSTFDPLAVWFGAPNQWGEDENGELQPSFMTDEYFEAMKFMKKLYDEKLMNQDFATYDAAKWDEQFLQNKAGVIIDVADRARRVATNIAASNPDAEIGVLGYVKKDAASEPKTLPTTGYAGYFVFPKKSVVDEEDLEFILKVFDKSNDPQAQNLMNWGIEGRQYTVNDDGTIQLTEDKTLQKEYADLNQVSTGMVEGLSKQKYATPVAELVDKVYEENRKYVVPNPAEALISDTYSRKGVNLDAIITEARTKFIAGQIDEAAWKTEIERWKTTGGTDYIKEINEQYKLAKQNAK